MRRGRKKGVILSWECEEPKVSDGHSAGSRGGSGGNQAQLWGLPSDSPWWGGNLNDTKQVYRNLKMITDVSNLYGAGAEVI